MIELTNLIDFLLGITVGGILTISYSIHAYDNASGGVGVIVVSNDDIVLVSMCQRQDRKRIEKKLCGGCLSIRRVAAYGTTLNETPRGSPSVANSKILERKRENKGISKSK